MEIAPERLLDAIRRFVEAEQGLETDAIDQHTELFQQGYVDSFAVVRLIADLEKRLDLHLPAGSLIPEDFASVDVLHQRLKEL